MDWIVADTIRCSLSLWTTPQSIFLCSGILPYLSYPPKRKSYVLSTSVLDSVSLNFWINEKAATPHYERQECFLLLGFAMLCNGFEIQNHAAIHQPKRAAYFRRRSTLSVGWHFILPSMCYLIFNLPIPSWVFQNTIVAVPMSRFWANFLVFPVDGNFIHLILNWMGELYPPPNSPPKNRLS